MLSDRERIKGLKEIKKAFDEIGAAALKEFEDASIEIAELVQAAAVSLAPGPTGRKTGKWAHAPGNLKNKIRLKKPTNKAKSKSKVISTVGFGAGAAYGVPVELGHQLYVHGVNTGKHVDAPHSNTGFLRPAADTNRNRAHERFDEALEKTLSRW